MPPTQQQQQRSAVGSKNPHKLPIRIPPSRPRLPLYLSDIGADSSVPASCAQTHELPAFVFVANGNQKESARPGQVVSASASASASGGAANHDAHDAPHANTYVSALTNSSASSSLSSTSAVVGGASNNRTRTPAWRITTSTSSQTQPAATATTAAPTTSTKTTLTGSPVLPSFWNPSDKSGMIELSRSNLRASYQGSGKSDNDAASVRANTPIPSTIGIYYFEATITSKGRDGYIGIGVCDHRVLLSRLPGWEDLSYGYHGDDGHMFSGSGSGKSYGPTFTTGDVIGCCVNFGDMSISFTKNGIMLGVAFKNIPTHRRGASVQLYPCVGLRTPGEIVDANFGQKPFMFDIAQYCRDERSKFLLNVMKTSVALNPAGNETAQSTSIPTLAPTSATAASRRSASADKNQTQQSTLVNPILDPPARSSMSESMIIDSVILQYLVHNGYSDTASAFYQSVFKPPPTTTGTPATISNDVVAFQDVPGTQDMRVRQHMHQRIMSYDIDQVVADLERLYPEFLATHPVLRMQLDCIKFIGMINCMSCNDDHIANNSNSNHSNPDDMDVENIDCDSQPTHVLSGGLAGAPSTKSDFPTYLLQITQFAQHLEQTYSTGIPNPETKSASSSYLVSPETARSVLDELYALLCYTPSSLLLDQSPVSYMTCPCIRHTISNQLNTDIMQHNSQNHGSTNQSGVSGLEQLYKQVMVVHNQLVENGVGVSAFVDPNRLIRS